MSNDETAFWLIGANETCRRLGTSVDGLTSAEARVRFERDGPNELATARKRNVIIDLLRRLANPLVMILLLAATVAGATGDLASFIIILTMVVLSTALDLVQEYRAEATAAALKLSIALRAAVRRDGVLVELPVAQIVAGDVVSLTAGDLVPADGLIIKANSAQANESILTGEPYPVEKRAEFIPTSTDLTDAGNALFHGTALIGGTATMLVVATGTRTRFGAIAASLADTQPLTAFERGIHRLGLLIARLIIFLVLFVLLAHVALGRPTLQSFLFAMALAVGLTPELLPMIVTIALARGAQRMARARVVVKRLSAIHDLGQMDILCTDKTGTLTEAQIALVGHPGVEGVDDEFTLELAAVNARFETGLKSPLDEALLAHTAEHALAAWCKIDERPFDFERRRVSVLAENAAGRIEIVKGAPETILALCKHARDGRGVVIVLGDALRAKLIALHDSHTNQGLRLLGVAYKSANGIERIGDDREDGLIFAGFCIFIDPPKASATAAVARLEAAGVAIKLISGDAAAVGLHLMAALGIPVAGVLTGAEIEKLNDEALAARVGTVELFARVTPDQKTRIVRALQARGSTVGFIGDGINDAPAIRAADVGLSVDGATDVAREAADMIMLAPDLGVLADGVAEGRRTYANIMKYIRMGTSSNFGNMLTMALASLWLPFLPMTPVQVLLNNLIYDMSETGIPLDTSDAADVARPQGWDMKALLRFTLIMGPLSSVFDIATMLLMLRLFHTDIPGFRTGWFIESMATQILVIFVIRTTRPAWASEPHIALTITSLSMLAVALTLPLLPWGRLFGFSVPGIALFGTILLLVIVYLMSAEGLKRYAISGSKS